MKVTPKDGEKRITFYVDEEFHRAFKAEAARSGDSMQGIMLRLVKDWLGHRGALPASSRKQSSR